MRHGALARVPLFVLITAPIVLEIALVRTAGLPQAAALAPAVTAVPPFALLHDLRWLGVYESSAAAFVVGAAAIVFVRAFFFTAVLSAIGIDRTRTWRMSLRHSAVFALVTSVCLWPAAALLVGMAVFPLIYFVFIALPTAFLIGVVLCPYLLTGRWRQWPSWHQIGLQAASFVILSLAGGCIDAAPPAAQYAIAIAAGAFSAWIWQRLAVDAETPGHLHPVVQPWLPVIGTYIAGALLLAVLAGGIAAVQRTPDAHERLVSNHPVLWVPGFHSEWNGGTSSPFGKDGTRFSYRGLSPNGQPLHYNRSDTQQSIFVLANLMKRQVDDLRASSGTTVDVVADSEGAFVVQTYLLANANAPVNRVILSSPLLRSARAYYPPGGAVGPGAAAGATLGTLLDLFAKFSGIGLNRDLAFVRSIVDHAPLVRDYLGCHAPSSTSEVILLPVSATVGEPLGIHTENPVFIEDTIHGKIVRSRSGVAAMVQLLSGQGVARHTGWRVAGWFGRAAGSAWETPPLKLDAVSVWRRDLARAGAASDAAHLSCAQMQRLAHGLVVSAPVLANHP